MSTPYGKKSRNGLSGQLQKEHRSSSWCINRSSSKYNSQSLPYQWKPFRSGNQGADPLCPKKVNRSPKTADAKEWLPRLRRTLSPSSQGNRERPQAAEASTGSLWDSAVGEIDLLLIDLVNITSFPVKQPDDPKATALRDSTAHICMSVETHMDVQQAAS